MGKETWTEIDRPVGPMVTPTWCRDACINWFETYSNPPRFNLKTDGTEFDWPGKCFTFKSGVYTATHEDGRLERHAHDGVVSMGTVRMFRSADGELRQFRRAVSIEQAEQGFRWTRGNGQTMGHELGEWVDVPHLVTTQQQGYAGRGIRILRDDGQYVMLRGPWHIGAPSGYHSVTATDCSKPDPWLQRMGRKWWQRTGCFGLSLKTETLINIVSRYQAHIRLASVTRHYGGPYLEPLKPEWSAPKGFTVDVGELAA